MSLASENHPQCSVLLLVTASEVHLLFVANSTSESIADDCADSSLSSPRSKIHAVLIAVLIHCRAPHPFIVHCSVLTDLPCWISSYHHSLVHLIHQSQTFDRRDCWTHLLPNTQPACAANTRMSTCTYVQVYSIHRTCAVCVFSCTSRPRGRDQSKSAPRSATVPSGSDLPSLVWCTGRGGSGVDRKSSILRSDTCSSVTLCTAVKSYRLGGQNQCAALVGETLSHVSSPQVAVLHASQESNRL